MAAEYRWVGRTSGAVGQGKSASSVLSGPAGDSNVSPAPSTGTIPKYHCNSCQDDVSGIRGKCAECQDFDLCLQDLGNFPIFQPPNSWKAKDELALLEAVERHGFGNWSDVAEMLPDKTEEEVRDHYNNMYVHGNIGRATWAPDMKLTIKDHTCSEGGPLSPSLSVPLPPIELTQQEQQELGYMPLRDDFEREFDNEAESLVCNLGIVTEDEDIDIALKLAHIDVYSRRLRERLRRKRVAREYRLVTQFFSSSNKQKLQNSKKKLTREEKDFQDRMQMFCQFQRISEREQFFENLQKETELKARIKELVRYRRNGITKLEECAEFETARYKREKKKENKKKSGSSSATHRRSSMGLKKQDEKGGDITAEDQEGDDIKEETKEVSISSLPGFDLLSEREKKLCSSIKLKPSLYITFKTVLLKDHLQRQQGNNLKPRYPAGLDKAHRRRVIHFLVNSGWITAC